MAEERKEIRIAKQLDYKKTPSVDPKYRLTRLIQQTGGQVVQLNTAGGQESIFELPVKVFNLARSRINLQLQIAAPGAGISNYIFGNTIYFWQNIQFYNRGGLLLVDLRYVQNYTNLVTLPETNLEDFLTYGTYKAGTTGNIPATAATDATGLGYMFQPSGAGDLFVSNGSVAVAAPNTSPIPTLVNYTNVRHDHNATLDNASANDYADVKFNEVRYFVVGSANGATYINLSIPLSMFKNTLFDIDKDLYFNEIMLIRFVWNPIARIGFTSAAPAAAIIAQNTVIQYNAEIPSPADSTTAPAALGANAVQINNLSLTLALEDNQAVAQELISKYYSGGITLLTPFVYADKYSLNASTSQTITLRYNSIHGSSLIKLYYAPYNNTENLNTTYDHSNLVIGTQANPQYRPGSKVTQFYTALNNERLQEFNLYSANYDEWLLLKDSLRGSCILSSNVYYYNWFWKESFEHIRPPLDYNSEFDEDNLIRGLSLATEQKIDIFLTTPNAAYNHYSFAVTQKTLSISPSGIMLV